MSKVWRRGSKLDAEATFSCQVVRYGTLFPHFTSRRVHVACRFPYEKRPSIENFLGHFCDYDQYHNNILCTPTLSFHDIKQYHMYNTANCTKLSSSHISLRRLWARWRGLYAVILTGTLFFFSACARFVVVIFHIEGSTAWSLADSICFWCEHNT